MQILRENQIMQNRPWHDRNENPWIIFNHEMFGLWIPSPKDEFIPRCEIWNHRGEVSAGTNPIRKNQGFDLHIVGALDIVLPTCKLLLEDSMQEKWRWNEMQRGGEKLVRDRKREIKRGEGERRGMMRGAREIHLSEERNTMHVGKTSKADNAACVVKSLGFHRRAVRSGKKQRVDDKKTELLWKAGRGWLQESPGLPQVQS